MHSAETAGPELARTPRKNLPQRILRAIDDALHLIGLTKCLRATFAELCRFVPQADPFATIFAHKDKIAARLAASEATVYRHLAALEHAGLIERLPQERKSRNGRYAVARIRLTPKAAELVGLAANTAPSDPPLVHTPPSLTLQDGQTLTEPTIAKHHPARRTQNGLPAELACLTAKGISRAGVFALMGKASAKGKRLSDIVTVLGSQAKDLRGGRLFAYLAKLASGPTCFALAAANERRRLAEAWQAGEFARKAARFRERFRNCILTDREQRRLFAIDERARYAQVIEEGRRATVPLTDLAPWIERIESGGLVLATLATERRLSGGLLVA